MSSVERISDYLRVRRFDPKHRKTPIWRVENVRGACLGFVSWYGAWRQYVFEPSSGTRFHNGCLRDIADFVTKQNAAHRRKLARRRRKR